MGGDLQRNLSLDTVCHSYFLFGISGFRVSGLGLRIFVGVQGVNDWRLRVQNFVVGFRAYMF